MPFSIISWEECDEVDDAGEEVIEEDSLIEGGRYPSCFSRPAASLQIYSYAGVCSEFTLSPKTLFIALRNQENEPI